MTATDRIEADVCIVGAGAGGAVAAAELAEGGAKVVVLEQGPHHDAQRFTTTTLPPKSPRLKLPLSSDWSWRVRTLSGSAPETIAASALSGWDTTIGGSLSRSGGGGGGFVTPLRPDCGAALATKAATKRTGNILLIVNLVR